MSRIAAPSCVLSVLSVAMLLQPPAGLHCTASHYRTRRNVFPVWRLLAKPHLHTHTLPRARSILPFFPLVPPSNSGLHPLLSIVIVIRYRTQNDDDRDRGVDRYGVALTTTRFAEGDVLMLLPTRVSCLPPCAFAVSCPPVGVLFEARVCQQIPSSTSFPLALSKSQFDSRVLQLAVSFFV